MDTLSNSWIYNLYISQLSNTINHYQYLIALIISASIILLFKTNNECVRLLTISSFCIGIINIFVGLWLHGIVLETTLRFISQPSNDLISPFKCYIYIQLILGVISILILIVAGYKERKYA